MSFKECVDRSVQNGDISTIEQKRINDIFDEQLELNRSRMPEGTAEIQAMKETMERIDYEAIHRKRKKLKQAQSYKQASIDIRAYRTASGQEDPFLASTALIEGIENSPFSSVASRRDHILTMATSRLSEVMATFHRGLAGNVRNATKMKTFVEEVFNPNSTGDEVAAKLASAWNDTAEYLRTRFNAAGGMISARKDWGFPQHHNQQKIYAASQQEWIAYVRERVDLEKMLDDQTGLPMTPERLELALTDMYQEIVSNGTASRKVTAQGQGKSIANKHKDSRFLSFKDAKSWMEYQEKFGSGTPYDIMMTHIETMARDIAFMERLGPNPLATMQYIKNDLQKIAGGDPKLQNRATAKSRQLDTLYHHLSNKVNQPANQNMALTFGELRNGLTSVQLGSAFFLALADFNFVRITKQFNGLPQTDTLRRYLQHMISLPNSERRKAAVRAGLTAEYWSAVASGQMRLTGEIGGSEITRRLSDLVLNVSLLSPHTQANRWAFGMSTAGALAEQASKKFDELPTDIQGMLKRYNIQADHWEIIRQTKAMEFEGERFLTAPDIELRTDLPNGMNIDLANRYGEMIQRETQFAVPSSSTRGRAFLVGQSEAGTVGGELLRSFAQYKNFGVTLVNTHMARGLNQAGVGGKSKYLLDFFVTSTMMGALGLQLKEIAKGRDPRDMNDSSFWGSAILSGGGLGIYGDLLFYNVNKFGGGLPETIAGPSVGFLADVGRLTVGNALELAQGEETKFGKEVVDFAKNYTPGSSIWYLRTAMERNIFDQMDLLVNPKAQKDMRRLERKYQKERGQRYWWRRGKQLPERAPDLEAAIENIGE